jgi:hypothetical protein
MWGVELLFQKRTRKPDSPRQEGGGQSTDDEENDEGRQGKERKLTGKHPEKGFGFRRGDF